MHDVTEQLLETWLSQQEKVVVLDFWASWCQPCVSMNANFESVAEGQPDVLLGRVDIEHEKKIAEMYEVVSVPFTVVMHADRILFAEAGVMSAPVLNDLIEQAKSAISTE